MLVEFLYWEGCPSHPAALADLRDVLSGTGQDPDSIELLEVMTEAQAQELAFTGSPTIRVNGVDLFEAGDDFGLSCRIYRRRDGRVSPTPDPEELRELLASRH